MTLLKENFLPQNLTYSLTNQAKKWVQSKNKPLITNNMTGKKRNNLKADKTQRCCCWDAAHPGHV